MMSFGKSDFLCWSHFVSPSVAAHFYTGTHTPQREVKVALCVDRTHLSVQE